MRHVLSILLVAALVAATGCGSSSSDNSSTSSSTKSTTTTDKASSGKSNKKGQGSGGKPQKVIPPLAALFKTDGIKSPKQSEISEYSDALLAAQKACPKTAKLHLANLASFVHTHAAKYHVKVTALDGLKGASYDSKEPDCTKRFQAYTDAKVKHGSTKKKKKK